MQATITTSEIQETTTYKSLGKMFQNLLIKYSSRQQITYGINVHASTGVIPSNLGNNTLKIVKELIESKKKKQP
jgi:predicted metal-dependent TIM-barrel fold hydrolase